MGAALLTGCSSEPVDKWGAVTSGEVIQTAHKEHIDTIQDECWKLTLLDEHRRIGFVCVDESVWRTIKVGDKYHG